MTDARISNAREARASDRALSKTVIVTGDEHSQNHWKATLAQRATSPGANGLVISEQGRKGNFLGALQAYERTRRGEFPAGVARDFDQVVMLVGSGVRLSPITQSLRNMKAALLLPSNDGPRSLLTVGEAAIRSSAPWARVLREGGFEGVVFRWGDEIIIPSTQLTALANEYTDVDAVRFGYGVEPTELTATQKEWLIVSDDSTVSAELPRQPLNQLRKRIAQLGSDNSVSVNLGSFAASHELLSCLSLTFGDLLGEDQTSANWDPYLWMAIHSPSEREWQQECLAGAQQLPADFESLLAAIPDFWSRAHAARSNLESMTGRRLRVKLLDFGDPYWFDAGNHASLRAGLNDIFAPGRDGGTIRAFLGLPDSLAHGANFVIGSTVAEDVDIDNCVVIGSSITGSDSIVKRAIIVNSHLGEVSVEEGGVVLECDCTSLSVEGPTGFAFRLHSSAHITGGQIVADIGAFRLSYPDPYTIIDATAYASKLTGNPISFREAACLADDEGPSPLPIQKRDITKPLVQRPDPGTSPATRL